MCEINVEKKQPNKLKNKKQQQSEPQALPLTNV